MGNKKDLVGDQKVTREIVEQFALSSNVLFIETSSKQAENVILAFEEVFRNLLRQTAGLEKAGDSGKCVCQ